jgi:hypothetical protein
MTDPTSANQTATTRTHEGDVVPSITNAMSEPLLTENLKTLRVLHQLLMVVSAAILVFALRVDMSKDYKAALDELRAVKELDFAKWVTFVQLRYSDNQIQNDKFVREIVRQAGLPLQGNPSLNEPVFGDEARAGTLLQLDAFLNANQKIGILKLVGDKRVAAEQLKHGVAQRNPHPVVSGMWLSGFAGGYGQQMLDWRNPPLVPTITVNFNINDQPQTTPNQPVWAVVSFKLVSEEGHFAFEWLKKDTFGQKLVDSKTGEVLPYLKAFWEKVNGLTPDEATVFLHEQLEATTHGTVSFFGIPVETRLAISASPVICFSILLFLCLHVRHVRMLAGGIEEAAAFPFAPLFKSAASALVVTYVTVLILPILANAELLGRFGDWADLSTKVGAVFTVLAGATGIWTVAEIHHLRKRLFQPTGL